MPGRATKLSANLQLRSIGAKHRVFRRSLKRSAVPSSDFLDSKRRHLTEALARLTGHAMRPEKRSRSEGPHWALRMDDGANLQFIRVHLAPPTTHWNLRLRTRLSVAGSACSTQPMDCGGRRESQVAWISQAIEQPERRLAVGLKSRPIVTPPVKPSNMLLSLQNS